MSKENLIQALVLSEEGFPSLWKQRNKAGETIRTLLRLFGGGNFQEGVTFVVEHSEDLRVFLPREYRSRARQ